MKFLSLEPFVPSGKDFKRAKEFFQELGFALQWDAGDYVGFTNEACSFILQKFDNTEFASNFMLSVKISNANEFFAYVKERQLPEKFGVRINEPVQQPYGKEVNLIDMAGVCWHFVE